MFGTEACVMLEHRRSSGAVCHPLTVGEYYVALRRFDATPDTLYRKAWMSGSPG
jgi:hypothetical protein